MWDEAERWFFIYKQRLAEAGISLQARLAPDGGLLCTYATGVIRLALPDTATPDGALRATLLGALMNLSPAQIAWLCRAQLPRLIAHEIGHALRDEAGLHDDDPWAEEQAAERFACLFSAPHLSPALRAALLALLHPVVASLGGLPEALGCYRLRERAMTLSICHGITPARPSRASYRELATFLRVSVAWAYLDLLLEPNDDLDTCCDDLLLAGGGGARSGVPRGDGGPRA